MYIFVWGMPIRTSYQTAWRVAQAVYATDVGDTFINKFWILLLQECQVYESE